MKSKTLHRNNTVERQHFVPLTAANLSFKPELLYAGRLVKKPDWSDDNHSHNFCEIMFINSGKGAILVDKVKYELKSGDIVIYNAGSIHSEKSDENDPLEMFFIGVTNLFVGELPADYIVRPGNNFVINSGYHANSISRYFKDIVTETENKQCYYSEISRSLLTAILFQIFRILDYGREEYISVNENFIKAKRYIDKHYASGEGLDEICAALFMSKSYLSHLFKKCSGIPVLTYIIQKRIDMAKTLLSGSSLTVNEICEAVGYNDTAYFCRVFKNFESITPTQYRNANARRIGH